MRTEEKKKLKIRQISKIPGEVFDISEMIDSQKMIFRGNSTGGLLDALLDVPPKKGKLKKMKTYMPPKPKAKNNSDINGSNSNNSPNPEKRFQTPRTLKPNNDLKIDSSNMESSTVNTNTKKVKLTDRDISTEEEFQIKKIFHNMFLFDVFPEDVLDIILSSLFLINILKGDYLYKKGNRNSCFYIVLDGILNAVDDNDNVVKQYKAWSCFGHKTLMMRDQLDKMEYGIKAEIDSQLFALNGDTFLTIKQKLINLRLEERYEFLNTIIFFKALDCIAKHSVAEKMKLVSFPKGKQIIKKGEEEKAIYLIKKGSVSCVFNGKECKVLGVSNYVGIVSIIMKGKRTLDVFAKEETICFMLTDGDLSDALGTNYIDVMLHSIFKEYIYSNSTFSDLINDSNLNDVFSKFTVHSYEKNEKINEKNKNLKRVVLVLEGNFVNMTTMKISFSSGGIIGEETMTNNVDIPSNLVAFPDCLTLEANLFDISDFLGEEFRASTINLLHKVVKMKKVRFFTTMSENTLKLVVDAIKKEKFFTGQHIIDEDTNGEKFYVISKGTVRISKGDKQIREIEKDSFFGELALVNKNNKRTATAIAVNNVTCYVIRKKEFMIIANDESISKILLKQIALQSDSVKLTELRMIRSLGHGKFGNVSLVHNGTNVYAIKAICRREANIKKRIASYLIWERRIMLCLDHPFIVKMVCSMKNDQFVFLLIEFVNGICLKELLNAQLKVFNMNDTRFYIASLLLTIDYLHHKGIVHRDIKSNNIMVDGNGYIKLIDFGTAKLVKDYTNTIIGTPHYMAPEILAGKGYAFSCDYWSIGVVAYEIFYHKFPFGSETSEIMEIYNDIMYSNFKFPFENDMFDKLNKFIEAMLTKTVNKRPCSLSKIKRMELFDVMNWDELYEMKIAPPFKPEMVDVEHLNMKMYQENYEEAVEEEVGFRSMSIRKNEQIDTQWAKEF